MRRFADLKLRPYVWHPGTLGTEAIHAPVSSLAILTVYIFAPSLPEARLQVPLDPPQRSGGQVLSGMDRDRGLTPPTRHSNVGSSSTDDLASTPLERP